MTNNEKIRILIISFLSFCVLSSKNILIYNEETLVALSFFCFIFFVYRYFGDTIKDSLNSRSEYILNELQNFLKLKSNSYKELLQEHENVKGLIKAMKNIDLFTNHECNRLNNNVGKILTTLFLLEFQQKVKNLKLSTSKMQLQQKLQPIFVNDMFSFILLSIQKAKQQKTKTGNRFKSLHKKSIKTALQRLASN